MMRRIAKLAGPESTHELRCLLAGLLLTTLAGCGSVPISTDPNRFQVEPAMVSNLRAKSVALTNYYKTATPTLIFKAGNIGWVSDLRQLTETAILMTSHAMEKQGIAVSPQVEKTVILRVHAVRAAQLGNRIGSTLILEAEYGDGTKTTVEATNTSPVTAGRAVDGAILFALNDLLRHEEFVAYINR